ncbi:MAG: acetyl-CoA carboxylase biotin carboxyl carrier protein [Candidatus Krumholzibacteriia bacterium]
MRKGRIEYLIRLVEKSDIAELEISEGWGNKIRIAKYASSAAMVQPAAVSAGAPAAQPQPAASHPEAVSGAADAGLHDENLVHVVATMVGTFYRASAPDAAPFVDVGSDVKPGQTLCIIEAMKIMNEIASEVTGSVRKVLVENAQPVEFGQTLFLIEKPA